MFWRYFASVTLQTPVKSGLPSRVFGTGAVRLGLPLGRRGVFGNGIFTHCANAAEFIANTTDMIRRARISLLLYLPTSRSKSFSFSHTDSINSLSGNNSNGRVTFHGLV